VKEEIFHNWQRFTIGCVLLLIAFFFAVWAFAKGELTSTQRMILLWCLPLASGFGVSSFMGGLTVQARGWIPGTAIAAGGGFAVWLLSYKFLPPPPTRPVTIQIIYNSAVLQEDFEATITIPPYPPHTLKGKGSVTDQISSDINEIQNISVKCVGYTQKENGPFPIQNDLVKIQMSKATQEPGVKAPCSEDEAIAGLSTVIKDQDPKKVVMQGSRFNPKDVAFYYRNKTNTKLKLVFFSAWKYYRSDGGRKSIDENGNVIPRDPWEEWDFPSQADYQVHQYVPQAGDTAKKSGWCAVFVHQPGSDRCFYLGSFDMLDSKSPTLDVEEVSGASPPYKAVFSTMKD
jgi:hypothetical protein